MVLLLLTSARIDTDPVLRLLKVGPTSEKLSSGGFLFRKAIVLESMTSSSFFQGSIAEAIAEAQSNRRVLAVFISGEDEESLKLEQITWQDPKVTEEIQRGCVALKLTGGSTDAVYFSAIFPVRRVPTISLIGFTGALLQQHEGYIGPEEFVASLQQVLVTFTPQLQNVAAAGAIATILSSAHLASTATTPSAAAGPATNESVPEVATEQIGDSATVLSRGVTSALVERRDSIEEPPQTPSSVLDPSASDVQDMEVSSSTSRSAGGEGSLEDNQVLERLKAAEALKAAERTKIISKQAAEADSLKAIETPATKTAKERDGPFLLQIRLTNSENMRGEFNGMDTLRDVKSFVDKNRTDGRKSYTFVIPFPRRSLTPDDLDKSLTELELGPRSTVMIVPSRTASEGSSWSCATAPVISDNASTSAGGIGSFLWRLLSYLNPFSYLPWGASSSNVGNASVSDTEYDSVPAGAREADDRLSSGTTAYTSPMSGAGPRRSSLSQRKSWGANGNVHTLRNDDDDDVPRAGNSYWNGNSTQFGGEDDNKRD
ncbi:hypothetical protein R1flu_016547 [Riccia fluitans]|uniref:UBX domain-containing protein n=1 Tax=Riccia fluitans TaxID=41844 RepID=A0ABD1YM61_9MARC